MSRVLTINRFSQLRMLHIHTVDNALYSHNSEYSICTQSGVFNILTKEKVVGPVWGPILGQKSDFFGFVPRVIPDGPGTIERCSRNLLGVLPEICSQTFSEMFTGVSSMFQVFSNMFKTVFYDPGRTGNLLARAT